MMGKLELLDNGRGHIWLCYEGFRYSPKHFSPQTIHWRCCKRFSLKCDGRISTDLKLKNSKHFFTHSHPSDSTAMLVNEAIVNEMGWEDPIGQKLISFNGNEPMEITVIGVLKDFFVFKFINLLFY